MLDKEGKTVVLKRKVIGHVLTLVEIPEVNKDGSGSFKAVDPKGGKVEGKITKTGKIHGTGTGLDGWDISGVSIETEIT